MCCHSRGNGNPFPRRDYRLDSRSPPPRGQALREWQTGFSMQLCPNQVGYSHSTGAKRQNENC
jgi:hypothetical protein